MICDARFHRFSHEALFAKDAEAVGDSEFRIGEEWKREPMLLLEFLVGRFIVFANADDAQATCLNLAMHRECRMLVLCSQGYRLSGKNRRVMDHPAYQ